jgi:hypothetical protein
MRFKRSKKNWRKAELEELSSLVNQMTNEELCNHYTISMTTLQNTLTKYGIKRDDQVLAKFRQERMEAENNPNWKGGISKDLAHYLRIQRERHPEQKKARDAAYRAEKAGVLVRPEACQKCGKPTQDLHKHHLSYEQDKYLDVIYVCRSCHRDLHGGTH